MPFETLVVEAVEVLVIEAIELVVVEAAIFMPNISVSLCVSLRS